MNHDVGPPFCHADSLYFRHKAPFLAILNQANLDRLGLVGHDFCSHILFRVEYNLSTRGCGVNLAWRGDFDVRVKIPQDRR